MKELQKERGAPEAAKFNSQVEALQEKMEVLVAKADELGQKSTARLKSRAAEEAPQREAFEQREVEVRAEKAAGQGRSKGESASKERVQEAICIMPLSCDCASVVDNIIIGLYYSLASLLKTQLKKQI